MEKTIKRQQKNVVDATKHLNEYVEIGKRIFPLKKSHKDPAYSKWRITEYTLEQLQKHNGNFGYEPCAGQLVIDVDVKDKDKNGLASFKKLCETVGVELHPNVHSPSGGFHVYLNVPNDFEMKKNPKEYPGIDFIQKGAYVVIAGSHTVKVMDKDEIKQYEGEYTFDCQMMKACGIDAPDSLVDHLLELSGGKVSKKEKASVDPFKIAQIDNDEDEDDFDIERGYGLGATADQIKKALIHIEPDDYDEWRSIGMALKTWDKVEGLALWDEWSKSSPKYEEGACAKKWKTFKVDGKTTLGTLFYKAKENNPDYSFDELNNETQFKSLLNQIRSSTISQIKNEIIPDIVDLKFDDVNKSIIIKTIQDTFKKETGSLPGIKTIRDLFKPKANNTPKWCENWVYVNKESGFFNFDTHLIFKEKAFNNECGVYVPEGENGSKPHASKYVADNGYIPTVDRMAYYPQSSEKVFTHGGVTYANSFNHETVGKTASRYTQKGKEAINLIVSHLKMIMRKDEYYNYLVQWLAHNVQYMGKKITWSPCIQSIEGVGKTFILELMQSIMGIENVQPISPDDVKDKFNSWTYGKCVGVFEELRVSGQNRFEITDRIKPLITNRFINLHKKGVDSYSTFNTVNYICFTNHKDALPLNKTDRRWFVVYAPFNDVSELENYVGQKASEYFKKLYATIENHSDEIRKWFLEYKITEEFKFIVNAPLTDEKEYMISTEEANHEGYSEAIELLSAGNDFYDEFVISSSDFFSRLTVLNPELELNFHRKNSLLKKMGFMKFPKKIWITGSARIIWTKQPMTTDEIRIYIETRKKPDRYTFTNKKQNVTQEPDPDSWAVELESDL